jgi:transcriptional regulator with XRE-family HTH domain
MSLDDWMKLNELSNADMAELLGVHVISVSKYRSGVTIPRRKLMRAIVNLTDGEVTASDFYELQAA